MEIKFFVINLDKSPERLSLISSQFHAQKLNINRVPAIDGMEINLNKEADNDACKYEMGRNIQAGEVGCFLSHINALKSFANSNSEFAVILEDDAIISNNFSNQIKDLCIFLRNNLSSGICAINLGPSDYKYTSKLRSFSGINLLKAHRFPMLATGILWTRRGADLILSQHKKVKYPYDNYLRMALTNNSNGLSVKPALVWAADVTSDIEARSVSKGRSRENRSKFYFMKKQKRVLREKIIAVISIFKWHFFLNQNINK